MEENHNRKNAIVKTITKFRLWKKTTIGKIVAIITTTKFRLWKKTTIGFSSYKHYKIPIMEETLYYFIYYQKKLWGGGYPIGWGQCGVDCRTTNVQRKKRLLVVVRKIFFAFFVVRPAMFRQKLAGIYQNNSIERGFYLFLKLLKLLFSTTLHI